MSNKLMNIVGDVAISTLKNMISPDEKVKQVSRRTVVITDKGEHTVWEVVKKSGATAIFSNSKKKK